MLLQKAVLDSLFLFNQSEHHRIYTLAQFNHYCIFPLLHNKARLFYENDKPIGFVSWAWFTEKESLDFLKESWIPDEEVYKRQISDELWGIEFIAPFDHGKALVRNMIKETYKVAKAHLETDHKVHWRRVSAPHKRLTRRV